MHNSFLCEKFFTAALVYVLKTSFEIVRIWRTLSRNFGFGALEYYRAGFFEILYSTVSICVRLLSYSVAI